jgi:hypothetical protein
MFSFNYTNVVEEIYGVKKVLHIMEISTMKFFLAATLLIN